jgi:hypothetical protein
MQRLLFILFLNCWLGNAQSPVYSLIEEGFGMTEGAYYKDTTNEFDKFAGTWKYQNGNEQLQITFQKKVMLYSPGL